MSQHWDNKLMRWVKDARTGEAMTLNESRTARCEPMRERPILFSGPMVKAILSGAKSQTRRLIRTEWWRCLDAEDASDRAAALAMSPYGVPGDRLWVRETWAHDARSLEALRAEVEDAFGSSHGPYYRTDSVHEGSGLRWRPSIHMPRWASRLTLELTEVRVERLQSISEADALAEGVDPYEWPGGPCNASGRGAYQELWDRLNSKRAPWASNPWVWVISFRRVESADGKAAANG